MSCGGEQSDIMAYSGGGGMCPDGYTVNTPIVVVVILLLLYGMGFFNNILGLGYVSRRSRRSRSRVVDFGQSIGGGGGIF